MLEYSRTLVASTPPPHMRRPPCTSARQLWCAPCLSRAGAQPAAVLAASRPVSRPVVFVCCCALASASARAVRCAQPCRRGCECTGGYARNDGKARRMRDAIAVRIGCAWCADGGRCDRVVAAQDEARRRRGRQDERTVATHCTVAQMDVQCSTQLLSLKRIRPLPSDNTAALTTAVDRETFLQRMYWGDTPSIIPVQPPPRPAAATQSCYSG
jgi:hypothetical protein